MSWEVTSRLCFADLEDSFRFLEVYTGQADPVAGVKVYSIVGLNCPGSSIVLCSSLSWSFGCLFRKREWSCGQSVAKPRDWLLALSPLVASDEGLVQTICVSLLWWRHWYDGQWTGLCTALSLVGDGPPSWRRVLLSEGVV